MEIFRQRSEFQGHHLRVPNNRHFHVYGLQLRRAVLQTLVGTPLIDTVFEALGSVPALKTTATKIMV